MLPLSAIVIETKNDISSNESMIVLLKLDVPSLVDPIYIARNNENITWNTVEWISFPFDIDDVNDDISGEVPEVSIKIANASRTIEQYLIEYDLWLKANSHIPVTATIYVINTADIANNTPIVSYEFEVSSFNTDAEWAYFRLTFKNFYNMRFPKNRMMRNSCRWKFGSAECGHTIVGNETCNKTLTDCKSYNNSLRYGGFPRRWKAYEVILVNQFVGIPFKDGEPSYKGANCITLVELFYKDFLGVEISKIRIDAVNTRRAFLEYLQQISQNWIKLHIPEQYCVVAMSYDQKHPRLVQHFGIYLGDGKVLHTLNKINSHIVTLESLKPFIKGYYKWQS